MLLLVIIHIITKEEKSCLKASLAEITFTCEDSNIVGISLAQKLPC